MVKKLKDLCLFCIGWNLDHIERVGKFLAPVHKEALLEILANHDMFTTSYLPHITYNLFSATLKRVDFYKCGQITDQVLKQLGSCGCKLTSVTIHGCKKVTDAGIRDLIKTQDCLIDLHLRKLVRVTGQGLAHMNAPALHMLDLRNCVGMTPQALESVLISHPHLKELNIADCHSLSDSVFPVIAYRLQGNLEALDVSNIHTLSDSSLLALADKCTNLVKLVLQGCNRISHVGLEKVCTQCTKLEELDLSYCAQLQKPASYESLKLLPESLTFLSLCGILIENPDALVTCVVQLTNIRSLRMCGVPAINDESLDQMLRAVGENLELLDLSAGIMVTLTDEGLKAISRHCRSLHTIALSLLMELHCEGLLPLLNDPDRASELTQLFLSCKKLSEEVVYKAASNCHNLEVLKLAGVTLVEDDVLQILARNAPRLTSISLKGCNQVTDAGICALARYCPLKCLVIAGIHNITDRSIFALASSCTSLEEIYLSSCAQVSPVVVQYLQDCCVRRLFVEHKIPNAAPNQLMAKNLDTGEFCRADLMATF